MVIEMLIQKVDQEDQVVEDQVLILLLEMLPVQLYLLQVRRKEIMEEQEEVHVLIQQVEEVEELVQLVLLVLLLQLQEQEEQVQQIVFQVHQ